MSIKDSSYRLMIQVSTNMHVNFVNMEKAERNTGQDTDLLHKWRELW